MDMRPSLFQLPSGKGRRRPNVAVTGDQEGAVMLSAGRN
jgi:hypothetical protein